MEEQYHILVVDDDLRLRKLLRKYLSDQNLIVTTADSAASARKSMEFMKFDIVVLDIMMPEESGLEFLSTIRKNINDNLDGTPVLMLTAMGDIDDRITGLEIGADDYLTKPFEPKELVLRIKSILRRIPKTEDIPIEILSIGDFIYDLTDFTLYKDGDIVYLPPAESSLLKVLAKKPGQILSREDLGAQLGISEQGFRTIDVQVTRLRKKIEKDPRKPRYLKTIRGKGYVIKPD
ncbi:MAG: response regulator [Alphaproteobacteria bacterium]|nr:response regulator [Alphaproteobacteria bacterium]